MKILHLQMLQQVSLLAHISLKAIKKLIDDSDFLLDFEKSSPFVWIFC